MTDKPPALLSVTSPAILELEDEVGPRRNDQGEPIPAGAILAELLATALQREGWRVDYRWTTYNSNALDARRGDNRYDVEVALADRDAGRWTISAKRRVGLLKRVFSGRVDPAELLLLQRHIDLALAADERITPVGAWEAEP